MIIGISGGRGAGKSTLCRKLAEILPNSKLIIADNYMHESSKKLETEIFKKLGIEKDPDIFGYNYYFENYKNVEIWISTIKDEVVRNIQKDIEDNKDKKYILIDWCFLPLCNVFDKCDYKICVTGEYKHREERLTERLINKNNSEHNRNDISLSLYMPDRYLNSIKFTDLSDKGYHFDYNVKNDSNIEEYYDKINELADVILSNKVIQAY